MKCAACRFAEGELVVHAPKALCRRCALIIAHFFLNAPDVTLSALWNQTPDPAPRSEAPRFDAERAFADFKAGVAGVIADADVFAHLELANAYAEMGLAIDAVRSAARVLSADAGPLLAQRAVELIFGQHARPDALEYTLRAMRTSN
jgi:hypothetical protein